MRVWGLQSGGRGHAQLRIEWGDTREHLGPVCFQWGPCLGQWGRAWPGCHKRPGSVMGRLLLASPDPCSPWLPAKLTLAPGLSVWKARMEVPTSPCVGRGLSQHPGSTSRGRCSLGSAPAVSVPQGPDAGRLDKQPLLRHMRGGGSSLLMSTDILTYTGL